MTSNALHKLVWDAPNLAAVHTIELRSPDFEDNGIIPSVHAAVRAGGENLSPALTWAPIAGATQLVLIIEDPDAPTRSPYLHCLALLDASMSGLDRGALSVPVEATGVQFARSGAGDGYLGPAPPASHGPHRYVFQLFALGIPLDLGPRPEAPSLPALKKQLSSNAEVLARGRRDGVYRRT
ncbi:YbhB/YbcL family Raf kinase inhibitor-like protein [Leifsonia sp. 2MCAF36]|uniref:YbhB/YbcL family Raf kinase inhibitor-like protein n=1 Tax=Leifsonia sp. 2MCAF36 TaxID=3232988 RepID=UPI003F94B55B